MTTTTTSHLVCLFCVTAGQNGENLGSDEEQIVLFVYLLYDVANNKVVTVQVQYVRPSPPMTSDDVAPTSESFLTEECRIQTSLPEDTIRNAQPLELVLDEFERFLCSKAVHPDHGGRPFMFCTDGQLHLRMCLLPEATRKNIALPGHFYRFFDLRKEFKKFYKTERPINCIKDMLDYLSIGDDQSVEYGVRHCQEMAIIVQRLINDGHLFSEPDFIKDKLEPGVCTKDEEVDDDSVVRARGLPWQSSDQDIARFFRGLNVARGGVALCLSQQGRRNGEALIRFDCKEHRDLALRKHKHHIGQRYIEVYRANGQDFLAVAGGSSSEAQEFLSRRADLEGQVIIRMRGLPYTCSHQQVLEFFEQGLTSVDVLDAEDGILFVHQADGRATGDAFVLFASDESANKALTKHRQCIGNRYIELFKSTTAEVQQVLNRSLDPRASPTDGQDIPTGHMTSLIAQFPAQMATTVLVPQQLITCGTTRNCLRMRGLPMEATVADILSILGDCARYIICQGVHLVYNSTGAPSGEAFIQMESEYAAELAATTKTKKLYIINGAKRYIEVIQCCGEDMNIALNSGLSQPSTAAVLPVATVPLTATSPQPLPVVSYNAPLVLPADAQLIPAAQFQPRQYLPSATFLAPQFAAAAPAAPVSFQPAAPGPLSGAPLPTPMQLGQPNLPGPAAVIPVSLPPPIYAAPPPQLAAAPGRQTGPVTAGPPTAAAFAPGPAYQSIVYWYPSPPMSPQMTHNATYYVQTTLPATVLMKGLPPTVQTHDVLSFIDGLVEVLPDVQFVQGTDGAPSGDAYVTFASRAEAERVLGECSRKLIGNCMVDMQMI